MSLSSPALSNRVNAYSYMPNFGRRGELANTVSVVGGSRFRAEIPYGAVQVTPGIDIVDITRRLLEHVVSGSLVVIHPQAKLAQTIMVPASSAPPVWMATLDEPLSKDNRFSALSKLVNALVDDLHSDSSEVDRRFLEVDVSGKHASLLVSLISTSFSWRPVLKNWTVLRDRIVSELRARNIEGIEVALKGLLA